jgi:hypothetical protein
MEINTFWKIVLKSIGLWLIIQGIYFIPQFFTLFILPLSYQINEPTPLWMYATSILILLIYVLIVRTFLFNSQWIINIFKLDRHFTSDRIDLNTSEFKILSIIVIIIGAVIFVEGLPLLVREIYKFFQQEALIKDYADTGWILFTGIKTLAGYLIMTNSKFIVNLIEKKNTAND